MEKSQIGIKYRIVSRAHICFRYREVHVFVLVAEGMYYVFGWKEGYASVWVDMLWKGVTWHAGPKQEEKEEREVIFS